MVPQSELYDILLRKAAFLVISIVRNVSGILNEVFLVLEQNPEVSVSHWLSMGLKKRHSKTKSCGKISHQRDLKSYSLKLIWLV